MPRRYLVPILHTASVKNGLQQFWMFLERNGTHLIGIEEGEEAADWAHAAKEFCAVNELTALAEPVCKGDFVFVGIDPSDKDLASFYSWSETPPGSAPLREAWRPFLWVQAPGSAEVDPWGVNKLLEEIVLAEEEPTTKRISAYTVIRAYLETP